MRSRPDRRLEYAIQDLDRITQSHEVMGCRVCIQVDRVPRKVAFM